MRTYFIFNNLKVDTFQLQDQPFPGFELLTWEHESKAPGTLWDLGIDAGFTTIGKGFVKGQLWVAHDLDKVKELELFVGVESGLTEPTKIPVLVETDACQTTVEAIVYKLREIKNIYNIVSDGHWLLKRMK